MPGPWCFAWAGGTIAEQVTLVTNGSTHGARLDRVTIVGDVVAGEFQLRNMASAQGLETGALYELAGPGLPAGVFFVFDDSVLAGLPSSLNLSAAATDTLTSATYEATKSTVVGTVGGTLTQGSNAVDLTGVTLDAGTYGIFGTGIGETNVPIGTTTGTTYTTGGGIMTVSAAYMTYDGGGTGYMHILAATPHTHLAIDQFGFETSITTYTVAEQDVRSFAGGFYPLQLSGFPTGDAYSVTGIPSAALASLTPGLVYGVSGNSIQTSSTFVAPSIGATAITLDQFATDTVLNAILTITGPRTQNAPFDPAVHNRFDEEVIRVEIDHQEGSFATLTIELRNPFVGLLATGRNLWCWLSWDQAWTPEGGAAADLVPLFNGRLVGVPRLMAGELVQLEFLARPDDLNVQKLALANELAVLPYYDPIWLAQAAVNPDTVLETYTALWHIDRKTLAVTASDILQGEDGAVAIGQDQAIYDRFSLAYGQPPLVETTITGTVAWMQQAEGKIDVTQRIVSAFYDSGSAYNHTFPRNTFNSGGGGLISCLCGDGLKSDWPKPGTSIGGGYSLSTQNDAAGYPLCYILDAVAPNGPYKQMYYNVVYAGGQSVPSQAGASTDQSNVAVYLHPFGMLSVAFPLNVYKIRMTLEFKANRRRTETATAVLTAGVQRQLSDSGENDRETISLSSQFVDQAVDPGGAIPIGDAASRSYFQTPRGALSFENILLMGRAKMRARARSVDVTFAVDWRTALAITLRHSVTLTDYRLPGGTATGKVKSYKLTASDTMLGEFTIGCTIGTGDGSEAQPGVPVYVDDGYVAPGYEAIAGAQSAPAGLDDFYYQSLDDFVIADDGLNLTNLTADAAVNECVVTNGLKTVVPVLASFQNVVVPTAGDPVGAMRSLTTTVLLDLKPLQGAEFTTPFYPAVSQLALPRTIDLSATSGR